VLTTTNWANLICGQQNMMDLDYLRTYTNVKRVLLPAPSTNQPEPDPILSVSKEIRTIPNLEDHTYQKITIETIKTTFPRPLEHPNSASLSADEKFSQKVQHETSLIDWLFEILEESTQEEQSTFLQFVWGVSTLPSILTSNFTITITDHQFNKVETITNTNTEIYSLDGDESNLQNTPPFQSIRSTSSPRVNYVNLNDRRLPTSHTCFFMLELPLYSDKEVLKKHLFHSFLCKTMND